MAAPFVIYTGHMIRHQDDASFPPDAVEAVRDEVHRCVDQLHPAAGFGSAACGGDLIVAEALLSVGAQLHLFLPFAERDFVRVSVEPGGSEWLGSYFAARSQAMSFSEVYAQPWDKKRRRFVDCNDAARFFAEHKADMANTTVHLIAVWDERKEGRRGSTADVVSGWDDPRRLHVINPRRIAGA